MHPVRLLPSTVVVRKKDFVRFGLSCFSVGECIHKVIHTHAYSMCRRFIKRRMFEVSVLLLLCCGHEPS